MKIFARHRETKFPTVYPTIYLPKWSFFYMFIRILH